MASGYEQHLSDRKRKSLITNGTVINSALSNSLLRLVFLDTAEGIAAFGDALAAGWPAVLDMGATYGTAFLDSARPQVGRARNEPDALVTVSMIARMSDALTWIDMDAVAPEVREAFQAGDVKLLQKVVLVRFPANEIGRSLGQHCVNEAGEIQVMFFPEDDPVLSYLTQTYGIRYFEVRSSNISGSPEEPFAPGAVEYATAIAAPVVAVRSYAALEAQIIDQALHKQKLILAMRRKRFGSFPIIRVARVPASGTTGDSTLISSPTISIVRAGNTTPDTIAKLVGGCFPTVTVAYVEEKQAHRRHEYASPFESAEDIQVDLLRADAETQAANPDQNR